MADPIYLDYAATTPLDTRVREAMFACLDDARGFGNPASDTHLFGSTAQQMVNAAAGQVAGFVGGDADGLIWTSGATESDNLAVFGAARYRAARGRHIVTTAIEHKAVLAACARLEQEGYEVSYLQPDEEGIVAPAAVTGALRPDTILVSVMHANNETGVVQDIAAIGAACRERGIWLHVDAAQSLGKVKIDMREQQIDLLTINAHKACGPKGIGALLMNSATVRRLEPLLFGGNQQRGMRAGTLATHQIAGFGATCSILATDMQAETERVAALRDRLWKGIRDVPGVLLNGHPERRLCSILNVSLAGVEGESLRFALSDLAVASGAACNSASGEASYVLRALGRSDTLAEASIRFSLGRFTTAADVDAAAASFRAAAGHLQALSPLAVTG